jgi:biotin carboxyl carrier protein
MKLFLRHQNELLSFDFEPTTQTIRFDDHKNTEAPPTTFHVELLSSNATSQLWLINHKPLEIFCCASKNQLTNQTAAFYHQGNLIELKRSSPHDEGQRTQDGKNAQQQGKIRSVMPGKIVEIMVKPGDRVDADQTLLVMEAMKMQNEIKSPIQGMIRDLAIQVGQSVETQALLMEIEPLSLL